jgi:hypothetical protein
LNLCGSATLLGSTVVHDSDPDLKYFLDLKKTHEAEYGGESVEDKNICQLYEVMPT